MNQLNKKKQKLPNLRLPISSDNSIKRFGKAPIGWPDLREDGGHKVRKSILRIDSAFKSFLMGF